MEQKKKIKVLYIAGWGRSGTTLLDNIFGQMTNFFSVGEIRFIWERNFLENRSCGCGKDFSSCEIWQKIIYNAFGEPANLNLHLLNQWMHDYTSTLQVPKFIFHNGIIQKDSDLSTYLEILSRLYKSTANTTGSKVIVDSSKFPIYAALLGMIPDLDVYILHMVRDPRAVLFSWVHPKKIDNGLINDHMDKISPILSMALWIIWNLTLNFMKIIMPTRYMLIKYEDFVEAPKESVDKILKFLDEEGHPSPFLGERTVLMKPNHTLSGNLSRFQTGKVQIRLDIRWETELSWFHKFFAIIFAWPLMKLYGYKI